MAKSSPRLRGPTRSLRVRLEDGRNRVALLENQTLRADLDKDAAELKRKIFKGGNQATPGSKKD